jgi:hypothetical protein
MGEVVDDTRLGVGLGRDDAGAVAAANVSNFIATMSIGCNVQILWVDFVPIAIPFRLKVDAAKSSAKSWQ